MKKTNNKRCGQAVSLPGFTLIELLVTIAIIGLLSTIVLVSFGPVRNQAKDATIKANLNQMRLATELFYAENLTYADSNDEADFLAASSSVNSASSPGTVASYCNATHYCMSANLATNSSNHWCIDSTGVMEEGTICTNNIVCE